MDSALEAGTRRRALVLLATPRPMASKRPLKTSPMTGSMTTVTPDPKRHMAETTPSTVSGSETAPVQPVAPVAPADPVAPVDLFGDMETAPVEPDALVPADTQMEESPGQVTTRHIQQHNTYHYIRIRQVFP